MNDKNIYEIQFDYKEGDRIRKFRVGPDRLGHVIVVGDTTKDAEIHLWNIINNVRIEVDEE